jgi:hypothetical protein
MYKKITCDVILEETDVISNIRLFDNGKLDWYGRDVIGGKNVVVYFRTKTGYILATSNDNDGFLNIGLDFLWPYVQNNVKNSSVSVSITDEFPTDIIPKVMAQSLKNDTFGDNWGLNIPNLLLCDNVKLHKNGTIMVSRCDEKEYTERDVTTMLSRAFSHSKATAKEIINWFKENK